MSAVTTAAMSALRARWLSPTPHERGSEGRIVVLVGALLLFESILYSAVVPMLAHYAHAFGASKPSIGVLVAAYPAGMVPGALLGAWIAARAGVRRTTVVGLSLFTVSIIAFGFARDVATLDALRFVQGVACGCVWGGGLTWVITISPREGRGEMLGSVFAAAIFGTILGPVIGTAAVVFGAGLVFSCVGLVSLGLAAWTSQHPSPPRAEPSARTPLRALAGSPRVRLGSWLIVLEAGTLGALGTLLPLRLSRFGASGVAIGATFLLASVISVLMTPAIGRLVDRRGPRLPLCVGLGATSVLMAVLPLPDSAFALAVVSVVALGGPLTAYTIPAMALITDYAERRGIALMLVSMVLNLAWAIGEMIGAPSAASISQATNDAVPLLLLAAIMAATLAAVLTPRRSGP